MYTVIIIDDEKHIREGLRDLVAWDEFNFSVSGLFSDGGDAIEYLKSNVPDVIFTDIRMNYISGLDVARYVYENKLNCRVVLISAYQEFELAQQGIRYGVVDYLTKPTDIDQIEAMLGQFKLQLDEVRQQLQEEINEKKHREGTISLLEEQFFTNIVMGLNESKEYIHKCMNILYPGEQAEKCRCFLADIYVKDYEEFIEHIWEYNRDQFEINFRNFLRIYDGGCRFHMVYKDGSLIEVLGICFEKGKFLEEQQALMDLAEEVERSFSIEVTYKLRQNYSDIYEIGKKRFTLLSTDEDGEVLQYLREQKKLIKTNIILGNAKTAQNLYQNVLKAMRTSGIDRKNDIMLDIISIMNDIKADGLDDGIEEVSGGKSLVSRAKEYVMNNIYRDVSSEEVAEQLYISTSYLSRIFRKETDETFLQYVTRIKMEKAIFLLQDPQYKTRQIGEKLGYKTPRYFSRLFRAYTGMNPSEYRMKILHMKEASENV